ncbi:MAG: GGDEF domain-containing protein [Candidatus Schekmanbacteria bacterium]|nr:GGDEF domain-containing protein [Candidatus Schekmanbacteria bacterium]
MSDLNQQLSTTDADRTTITDTGARSAAADPSSDPQEIFCVLSVISGAGFGAEFVLSAPSTVVGRSSEAEIVLQDDRISRRHARIFQISAENDRHGPEHEVEDLGSTNGIFVNNERVSRRKLADGDKIRIGSTVLRYESRDAVDHAYHVRMSRLARIDELTGLLNRASIEQEFHREYARALRYRRSLAIALLDLDHFKHINDTHGHAAGDITLKRLGMLLLGALRQQDQAGRYGGEEFLLLLPETSPQAAAAVAERLRRQLESQPMVLDKCEIPVTASIGVAGFEGSSPAAKLLSRNGGWLVELADARLYRAKADGRNRVCNEGGDSATSSACADATQERAAANTHEIDLGQTNLAGSGE